jgi:hypothetical protein
MADGTVALSQDVRRANGEANARLMAGTGRVLVIFLKFWCSMA